MENQKQRNKRKIKKILYKLWLTKAEELSIKETIKQYKRGLTAFLLNISEIIINAENRGDLEKEK